MQTCQHCHSVLVSPVCCAPHMVPMVNGQSGIPTPSVSGHMFHFPSVHLCHVACPQGCHDGGFGTTTTTNRDVTTTPQFINGGVFGFQWPSTEILSNPSTLDSERTVATKKALEKSGWYWGSMSWRESQAVLGSTSEGTFLIRDSQDPLHMFSISVQTVNGPTSARIALKRGKFKLSSVESVKRSLPEFSCVIQLVQHYLSSKHSQHMWVDDAGQPFSPIWISKALRKEAPKLTHLCRLVVNRYYPRSLTAQKLPPTLAKYLDDYPYWC